MLLSLHSDLIVPSQSIKEDTPFEAEFARRYCGMITPPEAEWLRRSCGICRIFCPECGTRYTEDVKIEKKDREKAVQKNDQITFEEKYETGEMINRTNHLIKYHSFWKYLFLSFITCGIYGIYVFWGVVNDINEICNKDGKKSPNYILVLLLSLLTCGIYGLYWWYIQGERLYKAAEKYGIDVREKGSTMLLWQILNCTFMPGIGALVAVYIMFDNMNQIALVYNGEKKEKSF